MKNTTALVIMDGYGYAPKGAGNAITTQGSPNIELLSKTYPATKISASGLAVGLPQGQMGNSEVGHLNLGAGRIVYQDITQIDKSIKDGDFFTNTAFLGAIKNVKDNDSAMHLVGLCSDGGVHSHLNHFYALLDLCKKKAVKKVYIHCITDGRDVAPNSAKKFISDVASYAKEIGVGNIATVVGRYYYMDRDNRWERVSDGYNAVFSAVGIKVDNLDVAIEASYKNKVLDEFIKPIIANDYQGVNNNDSVIFYNFRSDRARQISRAILEKDFNLFEKIGGHKNVFYVGMTTYDKTFAGIHTAFPPRKLANTLGETLGKSGKTQARVAETEKYAHVTFFFDGGVEKLNKGEQRALVPSPDVATYDLKPEMSAIEVTDKALELIGKVDVLIINYANCDMVGHTGVISAAIKATEVVDECVKKIADKILETGGSMLLTADHGNAEQMLDDKGGVFTAHTTNDVPFILISDKYKNAKLRDGGILADVSPTLLSILGVRQPSEMDGKSLIV